MVDGSTNSLLGMDDLERELKNFFLEVRAKLERGNKDDALCLLQANYAAVKEQINGGFKGIDQAAILDTLALGYMGVGDFKTVEHLLNMVLLIPNCTYFYNLINLFLWRTLVC